MSEVAKTETPVLTGNILSQKEIDALNNYEEPVLASESTPYFKMMLFGPQGVGKTALSCCFGKTLILSLDTGWEVVKNWPEMEKNVQRIKKYGGTKHFDLIAKALLTKTPPYDQYDTFVVDTMAQIQEHYIDFLMRSGTWSKNMRPQFNFNNPADKIKYKDIIKELPGGDDYHAARNVFRDALKDLAEADVNVIFINHTKKPSPLTPKEKKDLVIPNITEGLDTAIGRNCGLYAHMTVQEKDGKAVRVLDFRQREEDLINVKSRIHGLNGKKVKTETFVKILGQWQNRDDYLNLGNNSVSEI